MQYGAVSSGAGVTVCCEVSSVGVRAAYTACCECWALIENLP